MEATSGKAFAHGDPHQSNVLVFLDATDKYHPRHRIKMCDFGTSKFAGQEFSTKRHWRIVRETFSAICEGFDCTEYAEQWLTDNLPGHFTRTSEMSETLTDKEFAQCVLAPYRDYLEFFEVELRKEASNPS